MATEIGGNAGAGIVPEVAETRSGSGIFGNVHCRTNIGAEVRRPKSMNGTNPRR